MLTIIGYQRRRKEIVEISLKLIYLIKMSIHGYQVSLHSAAYRIIMKL